MKFLLILAVLAATQFNASACSCASPTKTFITSIHEFTAELEVVQIDTILNTGRHKFFPLVIYKLKVIKTFKNSTTVDFVWMENAISTSCQRGIFPEGIGQKYIITGTLFDTKEYKPWLQGEEQRTFLHVSSCGKTVLDVEGDNVFGVITLNNDKKIKEEYDRLMLEDEAKATAYYEAVYRTKHHKDLVQTMPKDEFYALMVE